MRLHEFSTRQSRLRHLKKVFDQIYRELASCAKHRRKTAKRKTLPPSAPRDTYLGRSVLSAHFPTLASTARHMPQRVVATRGKSKRFTTPRAVTSAAPRRRAAPRVTPPMSAPPKPPSKAAPTNQPTKPADASTAKAKQLVGQATVDQRNAKAAVTKTQAAQPPTKPLDPAQRASRASQLPAQPQLVRPLMPPAQQAFTPNAQAWRLANLPPLPPKP